MVKELKLQFLMYAPAICLDVIDGWNLGMM